MSILTGAPALSTDKHYTIKPRLPRIYKLQLSFTASKDYYRTPSLAVKSLWTPSLFGSSYMSALKDKLEAKLYHMGVVGKPHLDYLNEASAFSRTTCHRTHYPVFNVSIYVSRDIHSHELDSLASLWPFGSSDFSLQTIR